ncbi:hypothetical protein REC12_20145 [Desulfosporosinus sp. PR]|uniref:hypothetical protein n=1 Tax=Candidatus Desulfosporosinus nitrosoreducens TaxID=3401928 RepID=UPI0027FD0723|nr:hypothetical protein [Desulfosporosinus sp. PR]MDQ7095909.1 hypothetical protein [Desulfosporosinus sp. PR]
MNVDPDSYFAISVKNLTIIVDMVPGWAIGGVGLSAIKTFIIKKGKAEAGTDIYTNNS